MTERTYRKLLEEGLAALPTNGGVILDATFSSRTNRQLLREQCKDIFLQVVELDVDSGEIESRLRKRDQSAEEVSDARLEDFQKLIAAYESPSELTADFIKVQTGNDISDSVKAVLLRLAEVRAGLAEVTKG